MTLYVLRVFTMLVLKAWGMAPWGGVAHHQGLWDQHYFHYTTKILFTLFTVLTFAKMMQEQCWVELLILAQIKELALNNNFGIVFATATLSKKKQSCLFVGLDEAVKIIKSQDLSTHLLNTVWQNGKDTSVKYVTKDNGLDAQMFDLWTEQKTIPSKEHPFYLKELLLDYDYSDLRYLVIFLMSLSWFSNDMGLQRADSNCCQW